MTACIVAACHTLRFESPSAAPSTHTNCTWAPVTDSCSWSSFLVEARASLCSPATCPSHLEGKCQRPSDQAGIANPSCLARLHRISNIYGSFSGVMQPWRSRKSTRIAPQLGLKSPANRCSLMVGKSSSCTSQFVCCGMVEWTKRIMGCRKGQDAQQKTRLRRRAVWA